MLFPPFCTGRCVCRTPTRPRARLPPRRRFPAFWQCRTGSGRRKKPAALCPSPQAQWLCDLSGRRGAKPGGRFPARAAGDAGRGGFLALCGLDAEIPETRREGMRFPRDRLSKPIGAREGRGPFALSLSPAACMAGQGNFCLGKSHSPEQKSFPCNFCLYRIRFE